jgi:hypothetical protein
MELLHEAPPGRGNAASPARQPAAQLRTDSLTPVMTFRSVEEARLGKNHLEAEGIAAFVEGAGAAGTLSQARLLVDEADLPRAHEILRPDDAPPHDEGGHEDPDEAEGRANQAAQTQDDEELMTDRLRKAAKPLLWLLLWAIFLPFVLLALFLFFLLLDALFG